MKKVNLVNGQFLAVVLSERITIYFMLGTLLILTGMYFCNKRP